MESHSGGNDSVLGRLLEEISWEGRSVRGYRDGGRGRENVLTAEVLTALDFLPRQAFLGCVLDHAHGADEARRVLVREVEEAVLTFLPPELVLNPDGRSRGELVIVQPDAMITSASACALVEAKRIRRSSFQPRQLTREYLAVTREAGHRIPLLVLVLGAAPPVPVTSGGRLPIQDAISQHLPAAYELVGHHHPMSLEELTARVPQVCTWITWHQLAEIVVQQLSRVTTADTSIDASISRLAGSIIRAVARHS